MPTFINPPPTPQHALLSFPAPHTLLVTLNRPRQLNCINSQGSAELHEVWEWMDTEPSLRVGILTGNGRAFCAGADLKGIVQHLCDSDNARESSVRSPSKSARIAIPVSGFGGLARRKGKKPVICAVNGLCFGGGTEMVVNSDLVIASSRAVFGLPEVKRGLFAMGGVLPRLIRTVGKQRAMEMVLTGRTMSAEHAERWGFVNEVVSVGPGMSEREGSEAVVQRALVVAGEIAGNSPDAMIVSRSGVNLGWEGVGADEATDMLDKDWVKTLREGENLIEGIAAFVEKRKPVWKDSKL